MKSRRSYWFALPVLLLAGVLGFYLVHERPWSGRGTAGSESADTVAAKPPPEPVPLNRGPEVQEGFQGDVHPLLFGRTRLPGTADSVLAGLETLVRKGTPPDVNVAFRVIPAEPKHKVFSERDLSAFLPEKVEAVGQMWALNSDKVLLILKQFHPRASLHLVAKGRRAGPDGAFAVLRALSDSHLEVYFRIHAEFDLTDDIWPDSAVHVERLWYTPAYLSGRMLVNRKKGVVEYFRLGLPTETLLNAHITLVHPTGDNHDIIRIDRLELTCGNDKLVDGLTWTQALTVPETQHKLAAVFYKFVEIDWVPIEQAQALARQRKKPIFALVSWGALDDQSCLPSGTDLRAGLLSKPQVIATLNDKFVSTWAIYAHLDRLTKAGDAVAKQLVQNFQFPVELIFLTPDGKLISKLNSPRDLPDVRSEVSLPFDVARKKGEKLPTHFDIFMKHVAEHFGPSSP